MVEEDPVARVDPVGLPVVDCDEVGEDLRDGIRRARTKGRQLVLWRLDNLPVHLGATGLVEADRPVSGAHGLEHPEGAHRRGLGSELRHLEADLDVALGSEVVDLARLDGVEVPDEAGAVGEVGVVEEQPGRALVGVSIEMIDPAS